MDMASKLFTFTFTFTQDPCMGMHADCGHSVIMATSMAQLHMQVTTHVLILPAMPEWDFGSSA